MGANATGKTALGRILMSIFNFIDGKEYSSITRLIDDKKKEAEFTIDLAFPSFQLYRIKNLIPYSKLNRTFANYDYSIEYTQFISDETYSFIQRNSSDYILTRTQVMLNWILTYPFMRSMPSTKRVHHNNIFSDKVENYWLSGVTVKKGEQIIGFYILRVRQTELSVKYLYYDGAYQNEVFNSIMEHIINQNVTNFSTRNPVLADYTSRLNIFNKRNEIDISFSHPQQLNAEDGKMIQGGDGDSFV